MRRKVLSVLLSVMMCFSLLGVYVSADTGMPKVTGVKWASDSYVGSWDAYSGAQDYFIALYKDGDRINDGNGAALPGFVAKDVTSYDFATMIEKNGVGTYTFTVGAYVNSPDDLTNSESDKSAGKIFSIPVYDVNVNANDNTMGYACAEISGKQVTTASEGASIQLYADANHGYRFVEWQSSDVTIASDSFTMPAKNVNVEAVFEAFPAVSGLTWASDSFTASWNAYTRATKYYVKLYKDGYLVTDATTHQAVPGYVGNVTTYDFTSLVEAKGDGEYKFVVSAYVDRDTDLNDSLSPMSDGKKYDVIPNVTGLAWDTDSFKGSWDAYTGVDEYFVVLYKDGVRINDEYGSAQPGFVGKETSYDFSSMISKNGEGTYTFEVAAYISASSDLDTTLSDLSSSKKYTLSKYTITVETEGGNYFCQASSNPLSADQGETITLSATAGTGYHFVEWKSSDVEISSGSFKMPEKDVTVTAVFAKDNPEKYTVSFNMNGHGTAIDPQIVSEGTTSSEPTKPTEDGWIFEGWYADAKFDSAFDFTTVISQNTVLYAKWKEEMVYTSGNSDTQTWEKGDTKSLDYVFHRAEEDSKTFSLFQGIQVDDKDVSADNYDAASGSLILKIKPSYLETLSAGTHKLKVLFVDGSATVEFQIKLAPTPTPSPEPTPTPTPNPNPTPDPDPTPSGEPSPTPTNSPAPDSPLPKTGDNTHSNLLLAILLLSGAAVIATIGCDSRSKRRNNF